MIGSRMSMLGLAVLAAGAFGNFDCKVYPAPSGRTPLPRNVRERKKRVRKIAAASRKRNRGRR